MNKKIGYAVLLGLAGLSFADMIAIPADQPICRLYSLLQTFGTAAGVLVAAYAGFILASSNEIEARNQSKLLIAGVVTGLVIIWLAPLVVKSLVGATDICGW